MDGDVDLAREPKVPDKSLGELFADLTSDLGTLFRKEVELAKVETKEEVARAGKAGGMLGAGAFTGYMAVLFLSFAAAWLLDEVVHRALAFLIIALVYGVATVVLITKGRQQMHSVSLVPEQTVETLKEDAEWARAQKS